MEQKQDYRAYRLTILWLSPLVRMIVEVMNIEVFPLDLPDAVGWIRSSSLLVRCDICNICLCHDCIKVRLRIVRIGLPTHCLTLESSLWLSSV